MNNLFILKQFASAKVFAAVTIVSLILSAFPAAFLVANAANIDAVGTVAVFIAASPATGNSEYVQVKFTGTGTLDLEGWTISDEVGLKHTFPSGVTLISDDTYNVCGDSSLPVVCDAEIDSGGNTVWNNSGDTMTLRDETDTVVHVVTWSSTTPGQIQGVGESSAIDYLVPVACAPQFDSIGTTNIQNTITGDYFDSINDAIADCDTEISHTIELLGDITVTDETVLSKAITLEGNGNTIIADFDLDDTPGANSVLEVANAGDITITNLTIDGALSTDLHGINLFNADEIVISGVTINDMDRSGIVVNGSEALVNDYMTSGNGWNAINVDITESAISAGASESFLEIEETSMHAETTSFGQEGFVAHIYVDDTSKPVAVNDIDDQYDFTDFPLLAAIVEDENVEARVGSEVPAARLYVLKKPTPDEPVKPIFECYVDNGDDTGTGYFGYLNENDLSVDIAIGAENNVTGGPNGQDEGQPTTFATGRTGYVDDGGVFKPENAAFSVEFPLSGNAVWTLTDLAGDIRTASAGTNGSLCPLPEEVVTVHTSKIVCTDEADLPDWGAGTGGPDITETTATDWLAENDNSCELVEGWEFEWAPKGTADPGDTLIGSAGSDWTTFSGSIEVPVSAFEGDGSFWMREVLQEGYIPFTFGPSGGNTDDFTAEMYCHTDVRNYDNFDRIDNPQADGDYYCVAWNVLEEPPVEYGNYCGDEVVNQDWEECDGTEGCTEQCQLEERNQCTDLTLAKIDFFEVENMNDGTGDMTDNQYIGQNLTAIPNNTWFPVYWNGSFFNDPNVIGYEDVPGLAVQRLDSQVRSVMHGSATNKDEEHSNGEVEFWSWDESVEAEAVSSDDSGNNKLEGNFTDGSGIGATKAGDDEISIDSGVAEFWITTTTADDGFYVTYGTPVVCDDCEDELDGGWANYVEDSNQGQKKDGSNITNADRTDPDTTLNEADWTSGGSTGFFSLGFGGWIEVSFDNFVPNVDGNDISIHEATNGNYPLETALIEVSQDGSSWYTIGTADNTAVDNVTYLDIDDAAAGLAWIKYVRVTDTTDPDLHQNSSDGFDLDAVDATQTLCEMPEPETMVIDGHKFQYFSESVYGPVEGWKMYLYEGSDSQTLTASYGLSALGELVASTTTDENGYYSFTVPVGNYEVVEEMLIGWNQVFVDSDGKIKYPENKPVICGLASNEIDSTECHVAEMITCEFNYDPQEYLKEARTTVSHVDKHRGGDYHCDFYNEKQQLPLTLIDGYKYEITGNSEPAPYSDWTIYATNGLITLSTTTDETGYYFFEVPEGDWTIYEAMPNGWSQVWVEQNGLRVARGLDSGPSSCLFSYLQEEVNIYELPYPDQPQRVESNDSQSQSCSFYNQRDQIPFMSISGYKYDVTGSEPVGAGGWTVYATNGEISTSTITNSNGYYSFDLPVDNWEVYEEDRSGWTQVSVAQNGLPVPGESDALQSCFFDYVIQSQTLAQTTNFILNEEVALIAGTCDFLNEQDEIITTNGGGGGGGSSSSGTRVTNRALPTPLVAGQAVSQCPFLEDFMQISWENDTIEVTKLQLFLNIFKGMFGGTDNPVTGVFDQTTDANVKAFQEQFRSEILDPWYERGIVPHNRPTGFVYKTTLWKINNIVCPEYAILPDFEGEDLTKNVDLN